MAPRIADLPLGAPLAQDKCRLFKLPAELRNDIYQLALSVKPDENGQVALAVRKFNNATVLHLLSTCRIIYQEAAGIFYHQHNIRINVLQYSRYFQFRDFASPRRLQGLRELTVAVEDLVQHREVITVVCKRAPKLPALQKLTFVFTDPLGTSTMSKYFVDAMKNEKVFLKRAIKKLVSVQELRFEVPSVLDAEDQEDFRKYVDEVVAVLPNRKTDEPTVVKGEG